MIGKLELYKILFDKIGEGLLIADDKGVIELVNPAAASMFGYERPEELKGQTIRVLIPSRFHEKHKKDRVKYMKKPEDRPMGIGRVLWATKKDGSEFPVEIGLSGFTDKTGGKKAIALISDITEREKLQTELNELNNELEKLVEMRSTELRKSNLLYKSIARNFPNGSIYVFNKNFDYIFADGQALQKRGISGDDLIGVNYKKMVETKIANEVIPVLREVFNGENRSLEIEYNNAIFELLGVPLTDSPDNIEQILVVERDITHEKEVEKEIKDSLDRERELNNLKSRFVSIVSHEFRTPLAAINSSAELIEKYEKTEQQDKRLKHTRRIQDSVSHLNGMIEDILSLSKIEEGRIEVKKETFFIDDIVKKVIDQSLEVYSDQNVHFDYDHHEIESDKKLVSHILQNIISNAFKYTSDDKDVSILITEPSDKIVVKVMDQGIGIPKSEQKKLFERFYRATNVQNIKGTGLGLNIVSKYLEYIGGEITFTSEENKGSEFTVTFPKKMKL